LLHLLKSKQYYCIVTFMKILTINELLHLLKSK